MTQEHILIAEDERHARLSLSLTLRQNGFKVSVAENGAEALERIVSLNDTEEAVGLLITDIQMPELDGLELIDRLQSQEIHLPVIGITGYGKKEIVIELLRRRCADYLDKPFTPDQVLQCVRKVLESEKAERRQQEEHENYLEEERDRLAREIEGYKRRFKELQGQLDSAVGAYQNLIDPVHVSCALPYGIRQRPLDSLGGDFLDIRKTERGYDILIADVAGHDMGASYHTVIIKAFFDENCRTGNDGHTFFNLLNQQLLDNNDNDRMVTAMFVRLDLISMEGNIISACHPPLVLQSGKNPVPRMLNAEGDLLGLFDTVEFDNRRIHLSRGDRLFLFTDGIYNVQRFDSRRNKRMKLTLTGFCEMLKKHRRKGVEEAVGLLWEDVLRFCANKPNDDMLLFGLEL